jgi:hypothetical protein
MTITISFEDSAFQNTLKRMAEKYPHAAAEALNIIGNRMRREIEDRAPGGKGRTIAKTVQQSEATPSDLVIRIGSTHPGAAILHTGGTILPGSKNPDMIRRRVRQDKAVNYLTIPLPDAKGKTRARQWKGIFVLKSPKGNLFLVQQKGGKKNRLKGSAGLRFLFLLVREATITPHPYMEWRGQDIVMATNVLVRELEKATAGAAGKR